MMIKGKVGEETFGFDRWINQMFYRSEEWKLARRDIIVRDLGCDLGLEGYEIRDRIYIHHMNPIKLEDIQNSTEYLLDPNYLVCVSFDTHNMIHYGFEKSIIPSGERRLGDTKLW